MLPSSVLSAIASALFFSPSLTQGAVAAYSGDGRTPDGIAQQRPLAQEGASNHDNDLGQQETPVKKTPVKKTYTFNTPKPADKKPEASEKEQDIVTVKQQLKQELSVDQKTFLLFKVDAQFGWGIVRHMVAEIKEQTTDEKVKGTNPWEKDIVAFLKANASAESITELADKIIDRWPLNRGDVGGWIRYYADSTRSQDAPALPN